MEEVAGAAVQDVVDSAEASNRFSSACGLRSSLSPFILVT